MFLLVNGRTTSKHIKSKQVPHCEGMPGFMKENFSFNLTAINCSSNITQTCLNTRVKSSLTSMVQL